MTGTKTQTKTKPFPSAAAAAERSDTKHSSCNNSNKTHKTKTSPITPPWTAKDELEMLRSERSIPEHSSSPPAPSSNKSRQVGIRTQAPADHEQAADRNPSATSLCFPSVFFPSTLLCFATGRHESSLEMRTRDWDLAHSHCQLAMAKNEDLHRSTSVCSRHRSSHGSSRSWARRCAGKDTREKKESVLVVYARKTEAYRPTAIYNPTHFQLPNAAYRLASLTPELCSLSIHQIAFLAQRRLPPSTKNADRRPRPHTAVDQKLSL